MTACRIILADTAHRPAAFEDSLAVVAGLTGAQLECSADPYVQLAADVLVIASDAPAAEFATTIATPYLARVVDDRLAGDRQVLVIGSAFGWLFDTVADQPGVGQWPGAADYAGPAALLRLADAPSNDREHVFSPLVGRSLLAPLPAAATVWELPADGPIAAPQLLTATHGEATDLIVAVDNGALTATAVDLGRCDEAGLAILTAIIRDSVRG